MPMNLIEIGSFSIFIPVQINVYKKPISSVVSLTITSLKFGLPNEVVANC